MRVLVVAPPLVGHVLPLVPLAVALRDAGHEVVVATGGDAVAACPAGLPTADVAPGFRMGPGVARRLFLRPGLLREELRGRAGTRAVGLIFAVIAERMVDGVLAEADRLSPDLVVHEPLAAAGALAAARRGVPSVLVDATLFDAAELYESVTAAFIGAARRRHVDALPDPEDVLTTAPPSLVGRRTGRPMRFVAAAADGPVPGELAAPPDRPRVLVSRSTADAPGRDRLMSTVVAAAEGASLDVVLVRPDRWVSRRPLPPNVRTTGFVPFPEVFPAASAVIHHGGAGTLLTALAAGVPQLVVPGAGDRRVNAGLVADRGAGLAVEPADLDRTTLERLVGDASLRAAAAEVAGEIAAMPHPRELVPVLAELATRGLPAAPPRSDVRRR